MSTFISPNFQQSQFISGIPLDLVIQVGSMKQAQYNQAVQNTQSMIDYYGQQDIIRPEDREVINNRLNDTVNNLNTFSDLDLSDPRVQSQLAGVTSRAFNDSDITSRIVNNRKARQFLNTIEDTKKNHPEQYNSANEADAMDQFNKWYNDPTNNKFEATYTPYTDIQKIQRDAIDPILKNPDIRNEIEWYTDANGNRVRRGEREIKEVTRDKILGVLQTMPESVRNQYLINYRQALKNYTTQDAVNDLRDEYTQTDNKIKQIQSQINTPGLDSNTLASYNKILDDLTTHKDRIAYTTQRVIDNDDPGQYYTPNLYISNQLSNVADTYAFSQQGKLEDDFDYTNDAKFRNDLALANLNNQATMERVQYTANAKAAAKALASNQVNIANPMENIQLDLIDKGYSTVNTDEGRSYFNGTGKTKDDGSFDINWNGRNIILAPAEDLTIDQAAVAKKSIDYANLNKVWSKWKQDNPYIVDPNQGPIPINGLTTEKGKERLNSLAWNNFINSKEGKVVAAKFKQEYNTDLTDPSQLAEINTYLSSPQAQQELLFGKMLENAKGTANIKVATGVNMITVADGTPRLKATARFTGRQVKDMLNATVGGSKTLFGLGDSPGVNMFQELTSGSSPLLVKVSGEDEDTGIYEMNVYLKPDNSLDKASENYIRTNLFPGDKATAEDVPLYIQHNNEVISNTIKLNSLLGNPNSPTFAANILTPLEPALLSSGLPQAQVDTIINKLEDYRKIAMNPNVSNEDRYKAKMYLAVFDGVQTQEDLEKALFNTLTPDQQKIYMNSQNSSNPNTTLNNSTSWKNSFKSVEDPTSKFNHGNGAYGTFGYRKTGHLSEAFKDPEFKQLRDTFGSYDNMWKTYTSGGYNELSNLIDNMYEQWLRRKSNNNLSDAGKFNLTGSFNPSTNWSSTGNMTWQDYISRLNR